MRRTRPADGERRRRGEEGKKIRETLTHLISGPVMYSGSWLMLAAVFLHLDSEYARCWWRGTARVTSNQRKYILSARKRFMLGKCTRGGWSTSAHKQARPECAPVPIHRGEHLVYPPQRSQQLTTP